MAEGIALTPDEIAAIRAWIERNPTAGYAGYCQSHLGHLLIGKSSFYRIKNGDLREDVGRVDLKPPAFSPQEAADLANGRMLLQADRNLEPLAPAIPDDPLPDDASKLQSLFAAALDYSNALAVYDGQVTQTHTIDVLPEGPIGIAFLGDAHVGGQIEYHLFERDIQLIANTDGLYGVLMGDLMDNFKPQGKSGNGMFGSVFPRPDLQLAYTIDRARWAKGKWLALLEGNHEAWDGKWAGIDRLPALAHDLGCAYCTEAGGSLFVDVRGDFNLVRRYHIVVKHDYQGKSKINKGNSARRLWEDWPWSYENADVVCLAHLHEPHLEHAIRKGELVTYLRTGTYKLNDPYALDHGYRPAYGVPLIVLFPETRKIVAFPGPQFLDGVDYLKLKRWQWLRERDEAA